MLIETGVFDGEDLLQKVWTDIVTEVIEKSNLKMPDVDEAKLSTLAFGGRKGYHTEYLQPLLAEMSEVYSIDPSAEW